MRPLRKAAVPAAILAFGATGVALAHAPHSAPVRQPSPFTRVTGGTTSLTLSSAAASALSSAGVSAAPIAPATASGTTFTFPISGGKVNLTNLHGVIYHRGGVKLTHGTRTAPLRDLTIVANGKTASLWAVIRIGTRTVRARHHRFLRVAVYRDVRVAQITGVAVSGSSATGNAALTAAAARLLDQLSGSTAFKGGQAIGTVKVSPTFASSTTTTSSSSSTTSSSSSTTSA